MDTPLSTLKNSNSFQFSTYSELSSSDSKKDFEEKHLLLKNPQLKIKNIGHWNPVQKELYHIFLKAHRENFIKKQLRRTDKIFKEMARFIKTRAADQCRSHHQKMEKKFSTIDQILTSFKNVSQVKSYQQMVKTFLNEQTRLQSIFIAGPSQTTGSERPMIQTIFDFDQEAVIVKNEAVDEIEFCIERNDLFCDEVFNIDNYLLM